MVTEEPSEALVLDVVVEGIEDLAAQVQETCRSGGQPWVQSLINGVHRQ